MKKVLVFFVCLLLDTGESYGSGYSSATFSPSGQCYRKEYGDSSCFPARGRTGGKSSCNSFVETMFG